MTKAFSSTTIVLSLFVAASSFSGSWKQEENIPTARWHVGSAVLDGHLYAVGGVGGYRNVEAFDPATGHWVSKAPLATDRAFLGVAAVNGKLYAIGGGRLNASGTNSVEIYDPTTDSWTSGSSFSRGRQGVCTVVHNDLIYVIGGNNPSESTVTVYDPSSDSWSDNPSNMPTARWEPECAAIDDKLYVAGGFVSPSSGTGSNHLEIYDPTNDTWTAGANLPEARGGGAVATVEDKIYYFGGSPSFGSAERNVWEYDPTKDEWIIMDDMPFGWYLMAAGSINGQILLTAGSRVTFPHADGFRGTYSFTPSSAHTGIEAARTSSPEHPTLATGTSYPNPASDQTRIQFSLTKPSNIRIEVFDLLGKLVHSEDLGTRLPGEHIANWHHPEISSGTYTYRIVSSTGVGTGTVLVAR